YRALAGVLRWMRTKLRRLSPETRNLMREIESRMGRENAERKTGGRAQSGDPLGAAETPPSPESPKPGDATTPSPAPDAAPKAEALTPEQQAAQERQTARDEAKKRWAEEFP